MKSTRLNPFQVLRDQLAIMSFYERFEQVVALVLSAVIAVIIVVSLFQLISIVFTLLVLDAFNPLDHKVFQSVFGMIMTLLIAMEFKHSIVRVAKDRSGEGQDCIECADDGGQRQLADRVMFHVFDVPSIFCLENGPLLLGNRSGSNERRCRPAYRRPEGRLDRVWKPVVPILSQRLQKIYLLLPVLVLKI